MAVTRKKPKPVDPFDTAAMMCAGAERQTLSALLELLHLEPDTAREIGAGLSPGMFQADHTADVFRAMVAAWAASSRPAIADVFSVLRKEAAETGADYLEDPARHLAVDLANDRAFTAPQAARLAEEGAREVVELHARREAIQATAAAVDALRAGGEPAATLESLAGQAERLRSAGPAGSKVSGLITFEECVEDYLTSKDDASIRTGFRPFDEATDGGLPVGELTGLAAPPGAGKSAMALQLMVGAMVQDDSLRALWVMGEMTPKILVRRISCVGTAILGIGELDLRDAKRRTPEARAAAGKMREFLAGDRLSVMKPPLTMERITASIKASKAKVVVIDYVQKITAGGTDRAGELEAILSGLQAVAVNTETAIIVVSSMSKSAIGGGAKVGMIGKGTNDIDYAMTFLFEASPDEEARERRDPVFRVEWKARKARNDALCSFATRFDGPRQYYTADVEEHAEFSSFGMEGTGR